MPDCSISYLRWQENGMGERLFGSLGAEIRSTLRDFNKFMTEAGVYLLVVILASGGAFIFQPMIAGDDWGAYTNRAQWQGGADTIEKGRPMFALFSRLAYEGFALHPFDTVLLYATMTLFAFVVFRRWFQSQWGALLVISLFVTSPFLVEHLQFSANQIPLSGALLLLCVWFATIADPGRTGLAGTLLGALAGAAAITTRHELLFLLLGAAIIEVTRNLMFAPKPQAQTLLRVLTSLVSTIILAVCIVLLASKLTGVGLQSDGPYGTSGLVSDLSQLPALLNRFFRYWIAFLFLPHHLFPTVVKLLTWLLAAVALLGLLVAREYRRAGLFVLAALLLSAVPLSFGLVTVSEPYRYAGVFPLALYPCFIACVALLAARHVAWARRTAIACGMLIVAISSASLSAAQVGLSNLNRLDFSTINQFIAQIRTSGGPDWKIAILGTFSDESRPGGVWPTSIVECGTFDCQDWRLEYLLNLTLLERHAERRVFKLTEAEKAALQPALDALPPGSATLTRLPEDRFVILLK